MVKKIIQNSHSNKISHWDLSMFPFKYHKKNKKEKKKKKDTDIENKSTGYLHYQGRQEEQDRGRGLRGTNYYV